MTESTHRVLTGYVLDESATLTLAEISWVCHVHEDRIVELVEEGIIEPQLQKHEWSFQATQLRRAHRAIRLQRDLSINVAGVALVLDLLEEVEELRARLGSA